MALGHVYHATCVFTHPLADGELTFSMDYDMTVEATVDPGEAVYCSQLAEKVRDALNLGYRLVIATGYTFQRCEVFNRNVPVFGGQYAVPFTGNIATDITSLRQAPVVHKSTGLRGKSYNGRMYLLAPVESQQAGGVLDGATVTALSNAVDSLLSLSYGVNEAEWAMSVYSEKLTEAGGGTPVSWAVTDLTVRSVCGSQRGRQEVK